MLPWKTLASVPTREGELLLRQRGEKEFWITIDRRVLMVSTDHASEDAVATLGCTPIAGRKEPRVLIGGMGMGFTLRAALDILPRQARVTVAELTQEIDDWCRGPLATLTNGAANDSRVRVQIRDVAHLIAESRAGFYDAIVLDLYEGPSAKEKREFDSLYGEKALARAHAALALDGILAIWSEEATPIFQRRMEAAGFKTEIHRPGGVRAYGIYVGQRMNRKFIGAKVKEAVPAAAGAKVRPKKPRERR